VVLNVPPAVLIGGLIAVVLVAFGALVLVRRRSAAIG
jgi:hypothetical protein